jgi:hypothetical protein
MARLGLFALPLVQRLIRHPCAKCFARCCALGAGCLVMTVLRTSVHDLKTFLLSGSKGSQAGRHDAPAGEERAGEEALHPGSLFIQQFDVFRVGSYLGLTPTRYQSGGVCAQPGVRVAGASYRAGWRGDLLCWRSGRERCADSARSCEFSPKPHGSTVSGGRIPPQRRRRSASPSRPASSSASASSQSRKRAIFSTFAVAFGQRNQ